jgi:hypothetical protein
VSRGVPIPAVGPWPTKLERERVIRDLTFTELADLADVAVDTASRACRGERVTIEIAIRLWRAVRAVQPVPDLIELYGSEATT